MANALSALACVLLSVSVILYDHRIRKLENQMRELKDLLCIVEYRCPDCAEQAKCPAANTGVSFPCEYFRKEDPDGQPTKDL